MGCSSGEPLGAPQAVAPDAVAPDSVAPEAVVPHAVAPEPVAPLKLLPVALPAPRHGHRIEKLDGGLLAFGGYGNSSVPDRETRQTWWLAPGATQWQRRADLNA